MSSDEQQERAVRCSVEAVFAAAPRLSPAARRFMAGRMDIREATMLGFVRPVR